MKRLTIALYALAACSLLHTTGAEAAAREKVLYSFCNQQDCLDGLYPWTGVTLAGDELYTTTTLGGNDGNSGTIVAVNISTGKARVAYPYGDRSSEFTNLNGVLYGAKESGPGAIFSFRAGIRETKNPKLLYSFCSEENCTDGAFPQSSLLYANGLFYGMTSVGGEHLGCFGPYPGCGTVFSFNQATGQEKVLHSFCTVQNCTDGSRPAGNLIAVNGILYGTTTSGGGEGRCDDMGGGCGIVFSLDPASSAETVLHAFTGSQDGGAPSAGLLYFNGLLYGTTRQGGNTPPCSTGYGCGTIFSVDPATGTKTILHSLKGGVTDGEDPTGTLIEMNGKLFGTTRLGGEYAAGAVFSIDPATGKEKLVYSFCRLERCKDGSTPYAGLIQVEGTLYGTTVGGGTGNEGFSTGAGTIFSLRP